MLYKVIFYIAIYKIAQEQLQKANNTNVKVMFTPKIQVILENLTNH